MGGRNNRCYGSCQCKAVWKIGGGEWRVERDGIIEAGSPDGKTLQNNTPQPRFGVTRRPFNAGKWVHPCPSGRLFK